MSDNSRKIGKIKFDALIEATNQVYMELKKQSLKPSTFGKVFFYSKGKPNMEFNQLCKMAFLLGKKIKITLE